MTPSLRPCQHNATCIIQPSSTVPYWTNNGVRLNYVRLVWLKITLEKPRLHNPISSSPFADIGFIKISLKQNHCLLYNHIYQINVISNQLFGITKQYHRKRLQVHAFSGNHSDSMHPFHFFDHKNYSTNNGSI